MDFAPSRPTLSLTSLPNLTALPTHSHTPSYLPYYLNETEREKTNSRRRMDLEESEPWQKPLMEYYHQGQATCYSVHVVMCINMLTC